MGGRRLSSSTRKTVAPTTAPGTSADPVNTLNPIHGAPLFGAPQKRGLEAPPESTFQGLRGLQTGPRLHQNSPFSLLPLDSSRPPRPPWPGPLAFPGPWPLLALLPCPPALPLPALPSLLPSRQPCPPCPALSALPCPPA